MCHNCGYIYIYLVLFLLYTANLKDDLSCCRGNITYEHTCTAGENLQPEDLEEQPIQQEPKPSNYNSGDDTGQQQTKPSNDSVDSPVQEQPKASGNNVDKTDQQQRKTSSSSSNSNSGDLIGIDSDNKPVVATLSSDANILAGTTSCDEPIAVEVASNSDGLAEAYSDKDPIVEVDFS